MSTTPTTTLSIINRIYSAADGQEMWPEVLRCLSSRFSASKSVIINYDFILHGGSRTFDSDPDPYYAELTRLYASRNPWLRTAEPYSPGSVFMGEDLVCATRLLASEFYQDFLRPQDCFHRLCGVITRGGSNLTYLAIHRPARAQGFTHRDTHRLKLFLPHLQAALRLRSEILQYRNQGQMLLDLLHSLPMAVLLVDAAAQLVAASRRAEEMLARNDGLKLVSHHVSAASHHEETQLRRLIASAAMSGVLEGQGAGGELTISRPSGRRPLMLSIVPLGRALADSVSTNHGAAILIIKDPSALRATCPKRFAELYQLTPAQERLFMLIVGGATLLKARAHLGISKNTARTHMKQIYAKTNTHRQADLVRLYDNACLDLN